MIDHLYLANHRDATDRRAIVSVPLARALYSVVLVSRFSYQLDQSPLPLTKEALGYATEVDMTESGKYVAKEPSLHIG
jgi:hypothetical protein